VAAELLLAGAAAGTMALMVVAGGTMLDVPTDTVPRAAPAQPAAPIVPRPAAPEAEDSEGAVVTRRWAAAREIERQWLAQERAEASPTVPGTEAEVMRPAP
jgi:hypothetical protein